MLVALNVGGALAGLLTTGRMGQQVSAQALELAVVQFLVLPLAPLVGPPGIARI